MFFRLFSILGLILFPTLVWADIPSTDKSMVYLGTIFGKMGTLPLVDSGNILFGQIMLLFNQIVLALATLIVIYTVVMGTIHTAHEGEVMGKKWSSIFIPARIGAGLWLLVPASSGYSYIQIIIMWFLVQGVSVANGLWEQVLMAYDRGEGIYKTVDTSSLGATTSTETNSISEKGDENTLRGVLRSQICMQIVNDNPENLEQIGQGTPLSAFVSADGSKVIWGIQSTEQPVCGSATLPTKNIVDKAYNAISGGSTDAEYEKFRGQVSDLILAGLNSDLTGPAEEAVNQAPDTWANFASLITAQSNFKARKQQILTEASTGGSQVASTMARDALADGWIHAGSYYARLVSGSQNPVASALSILVNPPDFNIIGGGSVGQVIQQRTDSLTNQYLTKAAADRAALDSIGSKSRPTSGGSSLAWPWNEIVDALSSPLWGMAKSIIANMSSRDDSQDPILAIARTGGEIVTTTEGLFLGFIVLSLVAFGLSFGKGCLSVGHTFAVGVLSVIYPAFMLVLALLYAAGITFALYIPLIPFLVFTFAAITWMILVIEAIVAAPLVALILVVPSEDELGKAGHSLVILLGLVLRPALMILGFIAAIKFLLIGVKLLNFGFISIAYERLPPFSIFFPIAIIVLYASILTYIVHEAFSLIYVIPDKVLRWMGGSPEGEDIMGKVKKAEGDVEKGGGAAKAGVGALAGAGKSSASRSSNKGKE